MSDENLTTADPASQLVSMNPRPPSVSRRRFLQSASASGAGLLLLKSTTLFGQTTPSKKLNIALIGVWGRGLAHYDALAKENVVALCDVNELRFPEALQRFPARPDGNSPD